MPSHYVNERQDNWDTFLPLLALAYNTTIHTSTTQSPYTLMFGFQAHSLADLLHHAYKADANSPFGEELLSSLRAARGVMFNQLFTQQSQREDKSIALFPVADINAGDKVYAAEHVIPQGQKAKHARKWTGPYEVIEVTGPLSYRLRSCRDTTKILRAP
jgi:hypothetical protein